MCSQILRLASRLRTLVWLGIAMLIVMPSLAWFDPDLASRWPQSDFEWTWKNRLAAWALSAPPTLAVAIGLGQLLRFCGRVREQRAFTEAAATALRRFGWAIIVGACILPASRLGLWLYVGAVPTAAGTWTRFLFGQTLLAASIGLTIGLALLVFAALLREATRIAEENASFV